MIIGIGRFSLPDLLRNTLFSIRLSQNSKILPVFRVENFSGFYGIGIGIGFEKNFFSGSESGSGSALRNGIAVEPEKSVPQGTTWHPTDSSQKKRRKEDPQF